MAMKCDSCLLKLCAIFSLLVLGLRERREGETRVFYQNNVINENNEGLPSTRPFDKLDANYSHWSS
jgi:hypothetical protein